LGGSPRGLRGEAFKTLEDALDALLCGYVALLYGVEGLRRCAVFGTAKSGHIVIPMTDDLWREAPSSGLVAFDAAPDS
jgi:predicted RNase H-like nuclease